MAHASLRLFSSLRAEGVLFRRASVVLKQEIYSTRGGRDVGDRGSKEWGGRMGVDCGEWARLLML